MFSKLSILVNFSFLLLNSNSTVRCKPNAYVYKKYLIGVLKHIDNQPGWPTKEHLYLKHDNDQLSSVEDYLTIPAAPENYMIKLHMFTRFINCRYTEILFTFNDLLEMFLNNTSKLLANGASGEIRTVVEQSAYFFEKLSAAISFVDQLDLRIINSDLDKPDTIVEEVKVYLRFFSWKKTQLSFSDEDISTYAFNEHNDLKRFLENNARPKVMSLMETALQVCVLKENKDFVGIQDQIVPGEFVQGFSTMLVAYIHWIVTREYEEMGFEQLTNQTNSRYLKPPENLWMCPDGQEFLTKLFTYPGWSKLDYIKVKKFNTLQSLDYVRTPINNKNYSTIQTYTSRLIRFRYAELIFHYYCMFTVLINACFDEYKGSSKIPEPFTLSSSFIECAVYAHESMKTSVIMFEAMLVAVQKMKISLKNANERAKKWPLQTLLKTIVNFIENFELNNYAVVDFTEDVAFRYLQTFNEFLLNEIYGPILNVIEENYRYCQTNHWISKENFLKDKLVPSLQRIAPGEVLFKNLCELLNKFYGDVLLDDFKELGFHQVIF